MFPEKFDKEMQSLLMDNYIEVELYYSSYLVSHKPKSMPLSVSSTKSLDEAIDKHES